MSDITALFLKMIVYIYALSEKVVFFVRFSYQQHMFYFSKYVVIT